MASVNVFQLPLPSNEFDDIDEQYYSVAGAIASVIKALILADAQEILTWQLEEEGISPETWRNSFRQALLSRGWDQGSHWRTSLILSQSVKTAYNYGKISQLTPSSTKRFTNSPNEQRQQLIERAIASLPSNLLALLTSEIELSESLDFATKKIKNARNCKKGFPCGNSCISRTKMCVRRLEGQYRTAAEWLENQSKIREEDSKPKNLLNTQLHTEFIEQGNSAFTSSRKAEIDALLKGNPEEKKRIENEYISAQKEFMEALDNKKIRAKELDQIRLRHKIADDAYYNYEKYNRRTAVGKMEDFRLRLISEGLPRTEAKNILDSIDFDTDSIESINKSLTGNFTKLDLDDAIIEFQQLTGGKSGSSLKLVKKSFFGDGRVYATLQGDLSIGSNPDKATIFHELGHHVEFESAATVTAAKSWIRSRSLGEPKKLNELTNDPYPDEEIAYPDKFIKPYVGKIYPDATEVVSVGMEHFTSGRKMLELYEKDSEHFAFTVGAIKQ